VIACNHYNASNPLAAMSSLIRVAFDYSHLEKENCVCQLQPRIVKWRSTFPKKKEKRKKYFLKDVENFNFEQTRIKVRVLLHERLSLLYRLDWFNNVVYMNIE